MTPVMDEEELVNNPRAVLAVLPMKQSTLPGRENVCHVKTTLKS